MPSETNLEKVKKLRELTGAGFKDCSNAINENKGDIEKSIEYLRIKGISKASKKLERVANDGLICIKEEKNQISIIEINCETDFVAKNKEFINFSEELSLICFKEKGNLEKIKKTNMANSKPVEENLISLISKIGEKITIRRSKFFDNTGGINFSYIHSAIKPNIGKLGVIINLDAENNNEVKEFGHKLAMHVAASSPLSIDVDNLDSKILEKEKNLINEELKNSGKDQKIIDKISVGRIEKFKQENTLLNQVWVMDSKKKVKNVISEISSNKQIVVKDFIRYKLGE
tara:strand:+ start:267 stop:1127 length:861 start_codon:yes stop_codon:yes gene_type:complete